MKQITLVCATLLLTHFSYGQHMCSSDEAFAMMTGDASFVMQHENPLPFVYVPENGKMITYKCADSTTANAFVIPATIQTNNYLLVVHEWWGLNDYIKQSAEKIYNDLGGVVNVIAVDLYDGKVATEREAAKELMGGLNPERAKVILNGAIHHAGTDAQIATIGWCMGGSYSLQASILAGKQAAGCVMYYGFPETDIEKIKTLQADVLMMWPNQDKHITAEVVEQFKKNMQEAGKHITVREYNADHAFANPSNPKFDEVATKDAYEAALAFIKLKLRV